jgi:hypothetical protein
VEATVLRNLLLLFRGRLITSRRFFTNRILCCIFLGRHGQTGDSANTESRKLLVI